MIGYSEVSRIELRDEAGNSLAFVIETNGPSFRLFARHQEVGQTVASYSNWWAFMKLDRAKIEQREKADEAIKAGWREEER